MNNNRASAFYSGATRYGGSSAFAKRREAARKSFFSVQETLPSTSTLAPNTNIATISRSNMIFNNSHNKPMNLVHSYTINSDDIIRKEPIVPQLTSSAKRILSWIEQNSTQNTNDILNLNKRQRIKHRFNPMPYRAQIINKPPLPITNERVATEPVKATQHQLAQVQVQPFSQIATFKPQPLTNNVNHVPTIPIGDFKSPKFSGPSKEIPHKPCSTKKFKEPQNLKPKLMQPPKPPTIQEQAPIISQSPQKASKPVQSPIQAPVSFKNPSPIKAQPPTPIIVKASTPVQSPAPAPAQTPDPIRAPILATPTPPTPTPVKAQPLVQAQAPLFSSSPLFKPPPISINFNVPSAPIGKFKSPKFSGPLKDIPHKTCSTKKFNEPRNMEPKLMQPPKPPTIQEQAPKLTPSPFKNPTPIQSPIPASISVPAPSPVQSPAPAPAQILTSTPAAPTSSPVKAPEPVEAPIQTPTAPTTPQEPVQTQAPPAAASYNDIEMDIDPPTSGLTSPWAANATTASIQIAPNQPPVISSNSAITLAPNAPTTTNTNSLIPRLDMSTTVNSFVAPPLAAPVIAPVAPVLENNTPNYFQPAPKGGPARRILRAGRRLHR